eukprot:g39073.t1
MWLIKNLSQSYSLPPVHVERSYKLIVNLFCQAPKAEYDVLLLQFAGGVIVTLEEAQDGHVIQGVGGRVEMVRDWEVLSFVMNRAQALYKAVSEPPLGLTDVEEATPGTADAIDHISGCAGEHLSDVKDLFGVLNG